MRLSSIALIAALLMTACGSDSGVGDESGIDADALAGRQFVATTTENLEMVDDTTISIRFDDGTVGIDAGCNSMGGGYAVEGGRLVVDDLFTTEIGCDPERHAQDETVAAFITSRPTIELAGDLLTLSDGTVTIEMSDREVVDPDRRIVGTRWVLDGIIDGEAVSSVPNDVGASIAFADESNLTYFDGCNDGSGSVEVGDGELQTGDIASTRKFCEGQSEQLLGMAFATVVTSGSALDFEIEADVLTITNGDQGLVFRAAG